MGKNYLKILIQIPENRQDEMILRLSDFGFNGFEQDGDTVAAWVQADHFSESVQTEFDNWLEGVDDCHFLDLEVLADRNWNQEWEQTIRPQTIGQFYIHPTWTNQPQAENTIPVTIDPKMSFGTGYHETTRLLLNMLPLFTRAGDRILDMGSGTGILAIAALKLGANYAVCVDVDTWCFENAGENAKLNGVEDVMDIRIGSTDQLHQDEMFDIVLANINRNILLDLAVELTRAITPGGYLLLSGITEGDEDDILNHPGYSGLLCEAVNAENEWRAIGFRKPE